MEIILQAAELFSVKPGSGIFPDASVFVHTYPDPPAP
jgi:hypothetical protein